MGYLKSLKGKKETINEISIASISILLFNLLRQRYIIVFIFQVHCSTKGLTTIERWKASKHKKLFYELCLFFEVVKVVYQLWRLKVPAIMVVNGRNLP